METTSTIVILCIVGCVLAVGGVLDFKNLRDGWDTMSDTEKIVNIIGLVCLALLLIGVIVYVIAMAVTGDSSV